MTALAIVGLAGLLALMAWVSLRVNALSEKVQRLEELWKEEDAQ